MRGRLLWLKSIAIFCCLLAGATAGSCYREKVSPQVESELPKKASTIMTE